MGCSTSATRMILPTRTSLCSPPGRFKEYRAKGGLIGFAPDPRTGHECGDSRQGCESDTLSDVADGADAPDGWTILTSSRRRICSRFNHLTFQFGDKRIGPTSCG